MQAYPKHEGVSEHAFLIECVERGADQITTPSFNSNSKFCQSLSLVHQRKEMQDKKNAFVKDSDFCSCLTAKKMDYKT